MDFLVCVGGGGQHIALAVARMVRLGVWGEAPEVLVIDADLESPLAKRLRAFADPGNGQTAEGGSAVGSPHPIRSLKMQPPLATGATDKTFRASFLGSQAGGAGNAGGPIEEELYELFYNEGADGVDIKQGMAARPSVGAAVFADRGIEHLSADIEGGLSRATNAFVAASFIGGTGAGVTHQLVKFMDESPKRGGIDLFGTFLLPWIQLSSGGQGAANDVTIVNSARHGIQHFIEETAPRMRKSLLVGANGALAPAKAHDKQDETVSVFPLMAAYGLGELARDRAGAKVGDVDNVFTLTSGSSLEWLLRARWGGPSIADRWAAARVFESAVRIFEDPADGVSFRKLEGEAFKKTGIAGLGERMNWGTAVRSWADRKGVRDTDLANEVLRHLGARTRQLKMVTQYLHEVFGDIAESSLTRAGNDALQHRYANRDKLTKAQAYGYLQAAFDKCRDQLKVIEGVHPAAFIAEKMEQALMAEIVEGQVIQ